MVVQWAWMGMIGTLCSVDYSAASHAIMVRTNQHQGIPIVVEHGSALLSLACWPWPLWDLQCGDGADHVATKIYATTDR